MTDFAGTPQRTATGDANAGIVDPPSKRHANREIRQTRTEDSGNNTELINNVGRGLGNALQKQIETENNNTRERQINEAAMRQGESVAINSIDKEKQRSGWTKGIFGESAAYRGAQQRAATNAVNASYLEQATTIDKYAGESPEVYRKRLNENLDAMLEPYGNDAETKNIVASAWYTASAKLANKQYESHYAYNQAQQRQTYDTQVAQTFDTWTVEASLTTDPDQKAALVQDALSFFQGATKPEGMDDIAWRDSINTNLSNSLRKGNIGAYNAAKGSGWLETLTNVERVKLDEAISVYDTDFSQQAQLMYEEAELAAMDATTLQDAEEIYIQARQSIDELATRLSGTDRGKLALTRAQQQVQGGALSTKDAINKANEHARKIALEAAKNAQAVQAAEERHNNLKWSTRIEDPIDRAGFVSELDPKQSELEDALDDSIVDDITRLTGATEKMGKTEATQGLFTIDPKIAAVVAKRVNNQQVVSPMVKTAVEGFVSSFTGMANEDGVLSEKGHVVLQSIAQFEKDPANFKRTVGSVAYDNLQIVKNGLVRGKTVEMVEKEVNAFNENKGQADVQGRDWGLSKDQSKADKIRALVKSVSGEEPKGDSLTTYMEDFGRALQIYGGDTRLAEKYVKDSVAANKATYRGFTVFGGNELNKVTSRNFKTLMDGSQKYSEGSTSLLTPILASLTGSTHDSNGDLLTNLGQISGVRLYVDSARGGFYVDSFNAQQPVYISEARMKEWDETLEQRQNFQIMMDKKKHEFDIESLNNRLNTL